MIILDLALRNIEMHSICIFISLNLRKKVGLGVLAILGHILKSFIRTPLNIKLN